MEAVGLQVVKEVNSCLDQHGYSKLGSEKEEKLVALIRQIASEDHSVRQLISKIFWRMHHSLAFDIYLRMFLCFIAHQPPKKC